MESKGDRQYRVVWTPPSRKEQRGKARRAHHQEGATKGQGPSQENGQNRLVNGGMRKRPAPERGPPKNKIINKREKKINGPELVARLV